MFRLIVNYDTGDSFTQQMGMIETVGVWKSEELAIQNAARIAEHYKIYHAANDQWGRDAISESEALKLIKTKEWCPVIKGEDREREDYLLMHSLNLQLDNGSWQRFSTSTWCGYFERLNHVDVKSTTSRTYPDD